MATASGGEQIVGITTLSFSSNSTATHYTVPAGRYAKISFNEVSSLLGAGVESSAILTAGGASMRFSKSAAGTGTRVYSGTLGAGSIWDINATGSNTVSGGMGEVVLASGQTVATSAGTVAINVNAVIREFANP